MHYTDQYRSEILRKLLRPGGPSTREVSDDTGVNITTLYRWTREAKNGQMNPKKRSPKNWSIQEKFTAIREASGKTEAELGKWLREKGLHSDHLKQWEKEIELSLGNLSSSNEKELKREIKELNKEINRKDSKRQFLPSSH
jgi:transposase-like protein